jgi:hypothetical protein
MDAAKEDLKVPLFFIGAKLVVQCKKDWRSGVVCAIREDGIVVQINSPTGRTYRKKYPGDTPINIEGAFWIIGEGSWREGLVSYDIRW